MNMYDPFTGVINMKHPHYIFDPISIAKLTMDVKTYIDSHSFYGKFCKVNISENEDATFSVFVSMHPVCINSVVRQPIKLEYSERHFIDSIKFIKTPELWKENLAENIDIKFTRALKSSEYVGNDVEQVIFNRIHMD